jgi:hypothetical protein
MLDSSLGVGIIFTPESDELVKMVRPENGPISGQIVEVVHDDSNEQVDDLDQAVKLM